LAIVLRLLQESGATPAVAKYHFTQPGVTALGHYVSWLGLSTMEEKVDAVQALKFPENFQELATASLSVRKLRKW
jgi:hypothetical protein